ncbi:bifunctional phosphoribosyl-AMP cyclohydrolase/phosphoribosyl-ATP diphosphatase HisIE [Mucilaginibacter sp. BT774]|uniref:bifunctional phosphoribosyl-AMP cyclohydrolase/phosphoribosyl-ATP diphosphatase HisIE n=1 Tax=Mucilaginibacter sp. BT774 TaxID=3062276 RepID=UPI002676AC50|nr:bifunctional phosphoribosyl-AMP cyclohydrolase/phosphoribosyl-ATP diphosphatase HisIE [Mucilaginibacter sp. BT774]MDO3628091.1 bifunctional phosphoribosyl-AMP cyclohydrolase/phosphoribosyl-ATP diphosphatase HisIE [Mucilaginibacter sp. BT774]
MAIDFNKSDGLVPVIIQDEQTLEVLMLGYMNQEAYDKTVKENIVTFFSRSKNRLWTKGETSNNFLHVKSIAQDCDNDTLLIKVKADGPTCHTGARSCFNTAYNQNFILQLEQIINDRYEHPKEGSYVNKLREKGLNKIAQKVGEEAVETVIAALAQTETDMINESSDLVFHLIVLLREKGINLETVAKNLESRHK